jgi:hypothetical protein
LYLKIDFVSNPDTPYTVTTLTTPPITKNLSTSNFSIYKQKPGKVTDKSMFNKIHDFDLLYTNVLNQQYYKDEHYKNISKYYDNLSKSIDSYIGGNSKPNLYHILTSSLENDFCTIQFIFNYIDPIIFNNAVDVHYKIKDYISKKINNFELLYDSYIDWYNLFIGAVMNLPDIGASTESDFKFYFDKIFKESIEP